MPAGICPPASPPLADKRIAWTRVHRNPVEWATQPRWPEHDPDILLLDLLDLEPTVRTRPVPTTLTTRQRPASRRE